MRPSVAVSSLLLCALVAGCAQSNSGAAIPAANGSPLSQSKLNVAHSDQIGYVFGGGSGSAAWSAKGKDGSCSGTIKWHLVLIQIFVDSDGGNLDTNDPNSAEVSGTATGQCKGKPAKLPLAEVFDVTEGKVADGKATLEGQPPVQEILGKFSLDGPVCSPVIKLGVFAVQQNGDDIHIDQSTVTGTREVVPKKCKA
jgi:hypothetical protein